MDCVVGYSRGDQVVVTLNGRRVNARVDRQVSPGVYHITTEDVHTLPDGIQYNCFHAEVLPMLVVTRIAP